MRRSTSEKFAAKTRREVMEHAMRKMQREYSNRVLFAPLENSGSLSSSCCHGEHSGDECTQMRPSQD
ncbi:hypothetical protein PLESTB_001409300 [Pleodorina starrii]|uniref:Uncharacterized protein n=1 Tax=Pleodorina starrii TaxID=330485 RepID=A0A9W6BUX0_9CHLO|nr:hypothetical protein PLESTB_001409300 [Pleodorina starrii]